MYEEIENVEFMIIPEEKLIVYRDEFEGHGVDNGKRTWYARYLMTMLGYDSFETFKKAINKAQKPLPSKSEGREGNGG